MKTRIKSFKAILEACGCQAKPVKQSLMKHVNFDVPETGYASLEDEISKPPLKMPDDPHGRMLDYGKTKSDSDEGRRSRQNLYDVAKSAQSLHDKLRDEDDLPQWCAEYIAICADRIGVVEDYLAYKIKRTDG